MVIKNFKKNILLTGVILIIVGFVISVIGFGIGGFNFDNFKSTNNYKWYRTIGNNTGTFHFNSEF